MTQNSKRIGYVDVAKCLALVLVIYSHTPDNLFSTFPGRFFSGFSIVAFFFLSGYTCGTAKSWSSHVRNRAIRLLIPYAIFSSLFVLISRIYTCDNILGVFYSRFCLYPIGDAPYIRLMNSGNSVLWFLTAMFVSDCLFYALAIWWTRFQKKNLFLLIATIGLLSLSGVLANLKVLLPWSLDTAPFYALFMLIGLWARRSNLIQYDNIWFIPAFVIYIIACYFNGNSNLSVRIYGKSLLLCFTSGLTGTFFLLALCEKLKNATSFLSLLGRHTLVVFSIQAVAIHIMQLALATLPPPRKCDRAVCCRRIDGCWRLRNRCSTFRSFETPDA